VAVDTAGNIYITDSGNDLVMKLAARATTPSVLPFTGLNSPGGVAVDNAGNV
jgi:serine/threonine protein kinase, bacterial